MEQPFLGREADATTENPSGVSAEMYSRMSMSPCFEERIETSELKSAASAHGRLTSFIPNSAESFLETTVWLRMKQLAILLLAGCAARADISRDVALLRSKDPTERVGAKSRLLDATPEVLPALRLARAEADEVNDHASKDLLMEIIEIVEWKRSVSLEVRRTPGLEHGLTFHVACDRPSVGQPRLEISEIRDIDGREVVLELPPLSPGVGSTAGFYTEVKNPRHTFRTRHRDFSEIRGVVAVELAAGWEQVRVTPPKGEVCRSPFFDAAATIHKNGDMNFSIWLEGGLSSRVMDLTPCFSERSAWGCSEEGEWIRGRCKVRITGIWVYPDGFRERLGHVLEVDFPKPVESLVIGFVRTRTVRIPFVLRSVSLR